MNEAPAESMRAGDVFRFLIGDRQAILRIAATPWAWVVGAVLVLSAGIARNYDHLDLLRDPEWFIGPFVASLVTTGFVFIWVYIGIEVHVLRTKQSDSLTFLTLVWLTAPCAWLYGIPVERFTDIYTATIGNIGFLAVVSVWRVWLMARAVTVLTGAPWPRVTLLILVPAAVEMFFGSATKAMSLVGIMGGVRLPPHDQLLLEATNATTLVSFWVFVAGVVGLFVFRGRAVSPLARPKVGHLKPALIVAMVCLVAWTAVAVPGYEQMRNRNELKRLFRDVGDEAAVAFASSKKREDFPKIHYLAPEPGGYGYNLKHLDLLTKETPLWLREEWTRSAIEAHKGSMSIRKERLLELKERYPDIFQGLQRYEAELKAKEKLRRDEREWLERFEEAGKYGG